MGGFGGGIGGLGRGEGWFVVEVWFIHYGGWDLLRPIIHHFNM